MPERLQIGTGGTAAPTPAAGGSIATIEQVNAELCRFHGSVRLVLETQGKAIEILDRLADIAEANSEALAQLAETMDRLESRGSALEAKGDELMQESVKVQTAAKDAREAIRERTKQVEDLNRGSRGAGSDGA